MKPSHRKDVIIARIIFAIMCLAVVAIISSLIIFLVNHFKVETETNTEATETERDVEQIPVLIPESEVVMDEDIYVKTTSSVNMRADANKNASVITVLAEGTQLQLLSETDGWAEVIYDDKTGYVSTDYIVEIGLDNSEGTETE